MCTDLSCAVEEVVLEVAHDGLVSVLEGTAMGALARLCELYLQRASAAVGNGYEIRMI